MTTGHTTPLPAPKKEEVIKNTTNFQSLQARKVEKTSNLTKKIDSTKEITERKSENKYTVIHKGYSPGNDAYELSKYAFERAAYHYGIPIDGKYGAENMVKTFNAESQFRYDIQSNCYKVPGSNCASRGSASQREQSFGICQLHIRNNDRKSVIVFGKPYAQVSLEDMASKKFSSGFANKYQQVDTCIEEWIGASKAGTMPWAAYKHRSKSPIVLTKKAQI